MSKLLIELFTYDSAGCAACTYTKEAVMNAIKSVDFAVDVVEKQIKSKETVIEMKKRGITAIPTVCIDGDIVFESIIPDEDELVQEIKNRA